MKVNYKLDCICFPTDRKGQLCYLGLFAQQHSPKHWCFVDIRFCKGPFTLSVCICDCVCDCVCD